MSGAETAPLGARFWLALSLAALQAAIINALADALAVLSEWVGGQ